jgi:mRNA interferase MazF
VKRGEIWTAAAGSGYAGKPRPVLIVQNDHFDATNSVAICLLTTDDTDAPLLRLPVEPTPSNGLAQPSRIMVDKISTVPRHKLGDRLGRVADEDMVRLNQALLVFLGIAG